MQTQADKPQLAEMHTITQFFFLHLVLVKQRDPDSLITQGSQESRITRSGYTGLPSQCSPSGQSLHMEQSDHNAMAMHFVVSDYSTLTVSLQLSLHADRFT